MIQDTPDGKTYFCTHTDDNSICDECLGNPMTTTMRDRFLEEFEYFKDGNWSVGDELTEKHADYVLDFIEQELKKEREEIVEMIENNYEEVPIYQIINTIKNRV